MDGHPVLLRNVNPDQNHWLELKLVGGPKSPRDAVGATVYVTANGMKQRGDVLSGGSYLSSQRPAAAFRPGAGHARWMPSRFTGPAARWSTSPCPAWTGLSRSPRGPGSNRVLGRAHLPNPSRECFNLIIETGVLHEVGLRNTLEPDPDNTGVGSFRGRAALFLESQREFSCFIGLETRGDYARIHCRGRGTHPISSFAVRRICVRQAILAHQPRGQRVWVSLRLGSSAWVAIVGLLLGYSAGRISAEPSSGQPRSVGPLPRRCLPMGRSPMQPRSRFRA